MNTAPQSGAVSTVINPALIFRLIHFARRFAHSGMRLFAARTLILRPMEIFSSIHLLTSRGKISTGFIFRSRHSSPSTSSGCSGERKIKKISALIAILFLGTIAFWSARQVSSQPRPADHGAEPVVHLEREQPFVHISYQAINFSQPDYLKRALAPITPDNDVRISATMFRINQAGEAVFLNPDLHDYQWFSGRRFIAGGKGVWFITIGVEQRAVSGPEIRLRILDSRGNLIQDAQIEFPLSQPLVTIARQTNTAIALAESPLIAGPDSVLQIRAIPHFFPVPSPEFLTFTWRFQGRDITVPTEQPDLLQITIPQNPVRAPVEYSVVVSGLELYGFTGRALRDFTVIVP
jgi:hypothetical protein